MTMFRRPARGLFDFLVAVLCVWAAYYHTPAGALLRRTASWATGVRSTAKPLLAYYGGGGSGSNRIWNRGNRPGIVVPRGDVSEELALGYGVHAVLMELPPAHRDSARETATRYKLAATALESPETGPQQSAKLISKLKVELGSDDAAVLAVLLGYEAARYARDRAIAEGGQLELDQLGRQLPPPFEERLQRAAQALTLSRAYGLGWPVSTSHPVTSPFGHRDHPLLGRNQLHTGVDLSMPIGTPVKAVADGMIRRASEDAINGRLLVIDHGHGVTTAYCHNSALRVKAGDKVTRGQLVAHSGNTGRSTGPHLHYQLELANEPVDPLAFRALKPAIVTAAPRRSRPQEVTPARTTPPAPAPRGAPPTPAKRVTTPAPVAASPP